MVLQGSDMEADNDDLQDMDEALYGDDNDLYVQLGESLGKTPVIRSTW